MNLSFIYESAWSLNVFNGSHVGGNKNRAANFYSFTSVYSTDVVQHVRWLMRLSNPLGGQASCCAMKLHAPGLESRYFSRIALQYVSQNLEQSAPSTTELPAELSKTFGRLGVTLSYTVSTFNA